MTASPLLAADLLRNSARAYARLVVERMQREAPDALARQLPASFANPIADTEVRILTLAESVAVDRPALLAHSVRWYKVAFAHRQVHADYLPASLRTTARVLAEELPEPCRAVVSRHLAMALAELETAPAELPSHLAAGGPMLDHARRFLLAVLEGRGDDALDLLLKEIARGTPVADLHDHVLTRTQAEIGRMWVMGEIPIADEHYGSVVMSRALYMLSQATPPAPKEAPRLLALSVGGNLHEFGIRMVGDRFALAGWNVMNLGANMPAEDLEWTLADRSFDLVALSATMAIHVGAAARTIAQLRAILGTRCPPVLVGGEPFRVVPDLHTCIGADASAADAVSAVAAGQRLLNARRAPTRS
ncbi:MAG: hypothetical protein RL148_2910 [Planctomycetota bacterium]|jgi:methanogenic corrinoid protein MtbC1